MKAEIWKLRGLIERTDGVNRPLCLGKDDAKNILLRSAEIKLRRTEFWGKMWLNMIEK
jgi:hypothetical protein